MVTQAQVANAPAQKLGDADIVRVENNSKALFMAIDSLSRKFDRMTEFGDPVATYSDQNVQKVIAALEAYNAALKPFNGNRDLIPVSGKDAQQKLASINRWLGRAENAPLDPATVKAIGDRSKTSFNVVNNYMLTIAATDTATAADSVAAQLRAQAPAPQAPVQAPAAPTLAATVPTPVAPVNAPKAAPVEAPKAAAPVAAAPVTAAPQTMTVVETDPIRKNLDDLRFISEYASSPKAQDAARRMLATLTKARDDANQAQATLAVGSTKRAKAEKARTDANRAAAKFISENLNAAEAAQLRTVAAPFKQHARYQEAMQLSRDLDAIESQTSHDIKKLLPGIWLVGETQMGQMLDSLKAAYASAKAGKEPDSRMQLSYAVSVFDAEQKLYRRMLTEFVVAPATATISLLSQSTMPNKEALVKMLQANVASAQLFLSKAEVAYPVMADLFNSAYTDERAVKLLLDAWNYAQQPDNQARLQQLGMGQDLNDAFTKAVRIMSDKTFNPYITPTYTYERRKAIAALYLGVTDVNDRQLIKAEKEIAQLFKNSAEYRYNDAFLSVYETVAKITKPAEGAAAEAVQSIARLRALRTVIDMNYSEFVNTELTQNQVKEASADKARDFLQNAMGAAKKSGLKEDDPLMKAADKLAKGTGKTPEAATAAYQAAASLLAIREAQLWVTTPALQWTGYMPSDSSAATEALTSATELYRATFAGMGGRIPYHPNDARKMAEDAILIAAPPLLATTDAPATFTTFVWYKNPLRMTGPNGTATESDMAASAIQAEQMHINLVLNNMNTPDFLRPSTQRALEAAQIASIFASLDLRVGRSNPVDMQYGFPVMRKSQLRFGTTQTKVDVHFDTDVTPHEDRFLSKWGSLYQEMARQHNLAADQGAPLVLRGFIGNATSYGQMQLDANAALLEKAGDEGKRMAATERGRINDLRNKVILVVVDDLHMKADKPLLPQFVAGMQDAACGFAPPSATPTPKSMAEAVNKNFIAVLDIRIAELEHRLGGATVLSDGKPIRIAELANSKDDRTFANARTFLAAARDIRERARAGPVSGEDFQEAIVAAENGISLLSDDNLRNIERPKIRAGTYVVLDQLGKDMEKRTATVLEVRFRTADGRDLSRAEYEKEFGPQEITYNWFAWDSFKRTNLKGVREDVEYLYHPFYVGVDDTSKPEYVQKYVGQVVRDAKVKMVDGTTVTGDFVVRVRLTDYRSDAAHQWEPVQVGKNVDYANVLFQLEKGTRNPVANAILTENMARTLVDDSATPFFNPGKQNSVLIPHPADVSVVAAPRPLREGFGAKSVSEVIPKPATK